MKNQRNHIRPDFALVLALVGLISAGILVLSPARLASAQAVAPIWSYTGNLQRPRQNHTATLLADGKVLVASGVDADSDLRAESAELYDPVIGTWTFTGSLNTAREGHTATLLPNGKVLVAGGFFTNSAELYDPATKTWTNTGNLNATRVGPTATLLANGKLLLAGGNDCVPGGPCRVRNSAELYDPATGTWSNTGNLNVALPSRTATLLRSGKVLVVSGGIVEACGPELCDDVTVNGTELYDPATGTWSYTGNLHTSRSGGYTTTLLPNGKVLIAGGYYFAGNSAELYDPATGTWSNTGNLNEARADHTVTLLPNGKVLVAGGDPSGLPLDSAELYDPATETWSLTANLNSRRWGHTATLLLNGAVLVTGRGESSTELYKAGANPIDETQFFVRQHYRDFLNRDPDAGGLAYWTDRITQCGSDVRCIQERRTGVSAAFFIELEFQDTGYYVYRFYKAGFGRQPSYAEFTADRAKVIGGSSLEANKQAFADEWVGRPAFLQAYPITLSNTEFANKVFDTCGLSASVYDTQRQQEVQALNGGRSRALVLRDVIEIPDFKNTPDINSPRYNELKQISQYNPAFVLMQYFGYLRRNKDQGGYDFWLDVLNNRDPNNFSGMVCSFITSTEYQLRFGSVATHSNADCGR